MKQQQQKMRQGNRKAGPGLKRQMSGSSVNSVDTLSMLFRGEKGDKQRVLCEILDIGTGKLSAAEVFIYLQYRLNQG
jgi:hypothetical protein